VIEAYFRTEWQNLADFLETRDLAFIGDQCVDTALSRTFDNINPAMDRVTAQADSCATADVDREGRIS